MTLGSRSKTLAIAGGAWLLIGAAACLQLYLDNASHPDHTPVGFWFLLPGIILHMVTYGVHGGPDGIWYDLLPVVGSWAIWTGLTFLLLRLLLRLPRRTRQAG